VYETAYGPEGSGCVAYLESKHSWYVCCTMNEHEQGGPPSFSTQHWTQRSMTPALNTFLPYKVTNRLTHGAASSPTEYSLVLHITILATRWEFAMLHTGTGMNE